MIVKSGSVSELDNGWLQLRVPLPFALKWVNAYMLPDDQGWMLIDPGLRTSETEQFWMEALSARQIQWKQIHGIVLTHHHPDHYGLAGWMQELTGAPVYLSLAARDAAERLWGADEKFSEELAKAFAVHGLPVSLAGSVLTHLRGFGNKVAPHPHQMQIIYPGRSMQMGNAEWEIIGGEGHAPGHLSFYDRRKGLMICGDQVLPDISPNIGWMPGGDPDPLGSFLLSLKQLLPLSVTKAYPGHRDPFDQYNGRVLELLEHHERRLHRIMELIGSSQVTSFELCELLFGTKLRDNVHQLRFALAETIAHMVHLERRGWLERKSNQDETVLYFLCS